MEAYWELVLRASGSDSGTPRADDRPHFDVCAKWLFRGSARSLIPHPPSFLSPPNMEAFSNRFCKTVQFLHLFLVSKLSLPKRTQCLSSFLTKPYRRAVPAALRREYGQWYNITNVCEHLSWARHCAEPFRCTISCNLKNGPRCQHCYRSHFEDERIKRIQYVLSGTTKPLSLIQLLRCIRDKHRFRMCVLF